jgi:thymidylate synthase (FAD)
MNVEVLRATENPERLVCQAARGDYYEGYVGDTEYAELMKDVDYDESDLQYVLDQSNSTASVEDVEKYDLQWQPLVEAKTKSFIEKQLSRGHYGPWEHPQITFAVEGVSRVTMAQITRHRHMTFDIQSMRYADFSNVDPIVPKSVTDENHFSREDGVTDLEADMEELQRAFESQYSQAIARYQDLVDNGVPKEDARFVLPLGTPVNMTFSGNARTFLHLLDMRKKANAQWEIRELSEALLDELFEWAPYTFNYYEEHGPNKLSP